MGQERFIQSFNTARPPHNYELVAQIGVGGQATVYLAHDRKVSRQAPLEDRQVAVKVFNPVEHEQEMAPLLDEANKIKGLTEHPNIVGVHWQHTHTMSDRAGWRRSSDRDPQRYHYLAMDYVAGGAVQDHAGQQGMFPLDRLVSYVSQTALGMMHAHGETRPGSTLKVTHRDLKPPNLLLATNETPAQIPGYPDMGDHGVIKIADFGAATTGHTSVHTITHSQALIGTWPFVAPEHFNTQAVAASDVYSLGVIAYLWLTGRRPIEAPPGASVIQWYTAHLNNAIPMPEHTVATTRPGGMNRLIEYVQVPIMQALAKSTDERFVRMGDFYEAFSGATRKGVAALEHPVTHIDLGIYPPVQAPYVATYVPTVAQRATYVPTLPDGVHGKPTETATTPETGTPSETKRFGRRTLLRAGGLAALAAVAGDRVVSPALVTPQTEKIQAAVLDFAHAILGLLEDADMQIPARATMNHLIPHDPFAMDQRISKLRKAAAGKSDAEDAPAWLAARLSAYRLSAGNDALTEYLNSADPNIEIISRMATALAARASETGDTHRQRAKSLVDNALSMLESKREAEPQQPIVAALHPRELFKMRAFDRQGTSAYLVMDAYRKAKNSARVRALGMALVNTNPVVTRDTLAAYAKRLGTPDGQSDDTHEVITELGFDIIPYDWAAVREAFTTVSGESSGVADETSKALALELAPHDSENIMQYLRANSMSPVTAVIAMALAKKQPAYVRSLVQKKELKEVRPWLTTALNPLDAGARNDTLQMLRDNDNRLQGLGANMAGALLLAHLTRRPF